MGEISIEYRAPPTLLRFLQSQKMVRCVIGPVGSGKSSACCVELLRRATETPRGEGGLRRSRFAVIRNTYPELRDTTMKTFHEWIPERLGEPHAQENSFTMRFDDVESEVLFRALDRPQDVKKLLSLELTGAYINEAKEVPRAILKMLLTRIRRYPSRRALPEGAEFWSGVWMDSNPPDNDHWLYKLFEELRPPDHELFRQPGGRSADAENMNHLAKGYYADLAAANADDSEWVKVYVDGEYGFPRDGKPIYPEFRDAVHCPGVIASRADLPIILGMDFGLTPAAVLVQRDPKDGQLQVFDELVSEDMGAHTFARELARKLKAEYPGREVTGWGDPAGEQRSQTDEQTPFDVVQGAGLPVDPAPTNDFTLRREAVAINLKSLTVGARPGLVVSAKCRQLRKAMQGGYCYRRLQLAGEGRFADKPDKNMHSHVAEALQYALVGAGEDSRAVSSGGNCKDSLHFRVRRAFGRQR